MERKRDGIIATRSDASSLNIVFNLLQGPDFMHAGIFRPGFFDDDFRQIADLLPNRNEWESANIAYMHGLWKVIDAKPYNPFYIEKLKAYLTEMDRRRGTRWPETFPWLIGET